MLTCCLLLLANLAGLRAQTNDEYNFRQQIYAPGGWGSGPAPSHTMNCLAANGYGQWTITQGGTSGYPAGWYLLANGLYNPYESGPCIPPGVVSHGSLSGDLPTEPKVTANLDGAVNYVWPASGYPSYRTTFTVEGFYPSDIDISIASGFPNATDSRKVVKNSINLFAACSTWTGSSYNTHAVTTETDFRDEFDVASDAAFLYIVWSSTVNPVNAGKKEIWATVLDLSTHATVSGFPIFIGDGERPTIACDPRNNRGGGSTPVFEVAYLTGHTLDADNVIHVKWNGTSLSTPDVLTHTYIVPNSSPQTTDTYSKPVHARVLVSSVPGQTPTSAVYAISSGSAALFYYDPPVAATDALYVDGPLTLWTTTPLPLPLYYTGSEPSTGSPVVDNPIIAFADPYNNQGSRLDPFHCLYQLHVTFPSGSVVENPLCIVRGADNNTLHAPFTGETRLVLNQDVDGRLEYDPINTPGSSYGGAYIGAVNQMGIHVHWFNIYDGNHYYARDTSRTFDEDIDENTLVTDICTVSDGTSHGGTTGATIQPDKQMTIWTDPNYGSGGLYQPTTLTAIDSHVGMLNFVGDNVILTVSSPSIPSFSNTTLSVMPYFYFNFLGTGQGVTVQAAATFDYWGLNATHSGSTVTGVATPFTHGTDGTGGTTTGAGAGTIDLEGSAAGEIVLPANLNVHGGANFYIGPNGSFVSNYGNINVKDEPNIFPITTGSTNADNSGIITVLGQATISNSEITGHHPTWSGSSPDFLQNYIIRVVQATSPSAQYLSTYNSYSNDPSTGASKIRIEGTTTSTGTATIFNGDHFDAAVISGTDLYGDLTVENCTFANMIDPAIWLQEDPSLTEPYGSIYLAFDTFGKYNYKSYSLPSDGAGPIFLEYFFAEDIYHVQVWSNQFLTNDGQSPYTVGCAIGLNCTNAAVIDNDIEANKYDIGIIAVGDGTNINHSLLCHNTIYEMAIMGIGTWSFDGYIKFNELAYAATGAPTGTAMGYEHDLPGTSHLVFNNIHDNLGVGIKLEGDIDMSGVHHDPSSADSRDWAGYNTVTGNGSGSQIYIPYWIDPKPSLYLGQGSSSDGMTPSTWDVYGENNIQGTSMAPVLITGGNNDIPRDASNNYWGGIDPNPFLVCPFCSSTYFPDFGYTLTDPLLGPNYLDSPPPLPEDLDIHCGIFLDDTAVTKKKGGTKPQSTLQGNGWDSCDLAAGWGQTWVAGQNWKPAYDTLHWYLQHCYSLAGYDQSWQAFQSAAGEVTIHGSTPNGLMTQDSLLQLRNWLMSERHLNSEDGWYCECIATLSMTWPGNNRVELSILKFMIDNPRCGNNPRWGRAYSAVRNGQFSYWADTDKNPNTDVFDTTLPSFNDLGLDSLLADAAAGVHYEALGPQIILDARITANPFPQQTSISITTNREAYIHVEVFDLLGRQLPGVGYAGVFEPGTRDVPLDLSQAPSGTYYLRLSTANNETRTMKLSKE